MSDIATSIENTLGSMDAHTITNLFIFLIITLFILSIGLAFLGKGRAFTDHTPNLLTSLGILGTFVGIVIGLLSFDPQHIDESIELLLNGLKTAFITSLAGMATSIAYKLIGFILLFKEDKTVNEINDVEPKDILHAINSQTDLLVKLNTSISNDNESSLTGQIKLLRSDINDNNKQQQNNVEIFSKELWRNLEEFSKMLSKSATEQVIQALKEVISDFNKNLTEQFGENFKALDESVKKLVDWQSAYSTQLEHMIKQYSEGVKAITDIEASVRQINQETQSIPKAMSDLSSLMETNQHQINDLTGHLSAFKEMKDLAVKAVPEMQEHVEKTVKDITLSSQKASQGYNLLLSNTEKTQEKFTINIERVQEHIESTITQLLQKQVNEMNKSFNAMESQVEKSVEITGEAVNKHLKMIDDSMSQEVQRVMTEMGNALARISGEFTQDYQKLTNEMKKITHTMRN